MQFTIPALFAAFTAFAAAAPAPALDTRQGGYFAAAGYKYSGGGCNPNQLIYADPIFGPGNICQPLDRSGTGAPILSYKTYEAAAGCSVALYSTSDCTGTKYSAPVNGCVTGNAPFVSVFITCV
ncbi:hypothetical protein BDV96DRAFT_549457 [Lophiotrema nucula]|uniref:Uncharacterized protein n=1 Tax=Lophiotrema nucula TaxID=690887 RepID=A0A6A5Z3F2_9PLEO|nr:hypothetical protein BDV96DRAFT_549457 [Lophiotrema nucula]